MSIPTTNRRRVLLGAVASTAALATRRSWAIVPQAAEPGLNVRTDAPMACYAFDLADVKMLPGPFRDNMVRDLHYLASFDCDRLLAPFQKAAGLTTRAPNLGGWESEGLASHYCGHFMSAAAMMYAHTRDPRLMDKIDYLLPRLAECQAANGRDDPEFAGYCAGIPGGKAGFKRALTGDIDVGNPDALYSFNLNGLWSPWYTIHKIMAGLRDVYLHMGRARAKRILVGMTEWTAQFPRRLHSAQMQKMLISEQGGMNEVLADVYAITGNDDYLTLAQQFNEKSQLDPLMRRQDILNGVHSNQYIPRVIGLATQYELTGNRNYRSGAEFFWENVSRERSYAFGGNGNHEDFFPIGDTWRQLSVSSAESCCTYNILKLTNHYFCWNAVMEAADFFERALVNHILGSQDPETGMMTYYLSMEPGHFKTFSTPWNSCWCCCGTGMENHSKYARGVYYHHGNTLWVNLYMASELDWKHNNLRIRQRTAFPNDTHVRIEISAARPTRATIRLRHPYWSTPGMALKLNGADVDPGLPGRYLELTRDWHDGDVIEIELRMPLRIERMPHHPSTFAILAGPTVLAAVFGDALMTRPIPYADGNQLEWAEVPNPPATHRLAIGETPIENWIAPDPLRPLVWRTRGVGRPTDVRLVPYYSIAHERYVVYFDDVADAPKHVTQSRPGDGA